MQKPDNKNLLQISFEEHHEYLSCSNVMQVPYEMRCQYIKTTKDCQRFEGFVNYINFVGCGLNVNSRFVEVLSCIGLCVLFVYFLSFVAIVADQFFSPALKVTAKKLRMSEHLAGVTLLAFGNSMPDLLVNIKSSQMGSLFTYMMANAIFITLISGGLVCYLWPTRLPKYETIRTILFFILAVMTIEYMFQNDDNISPGESLGIVVLYIIFLAITIAEGYFEGQYSTGMVILESRSHHSATSQAQLLSRITKRLTTASRERERNSVNTEATRFVDFRVANPKNEYLFEGFVDSIQPINEDFWRESGCAVRIGLIILSPLMLFCLILIPMVDLERRRHGWSKLLNCTQIVITPLFASIIMLDKYSPWFLYQTCITVPLAIFIFQNSRTDVPPFYHFGFTFISALGSIIMLYVCTTETDEILKLVASILGLSKEFIDVTISCWGTSLCTIIINVILAHHGYAPMAFVASYAGPFFSIIIAMGLLPSYRNAVFGVIIINIGNYTLIAYVFLMISLMSTLIWSLTFDFYARRSVGIFNILIYCIYLAYCILCEREIIHSYAMDKVIEIV